MGSETDSKKQHRYYYEVFALPQYIAGPIMALSEHLVITDACILATLCRGNVPLLLPINRQRSPIQGGEEKGLQNNALHNPGKCSAGFAKHLCKYLTCYTDKTCPGHPN